MRRAATLLALAIVLGLGARAAEARMTEPGRHNFSITIGKQTFGYIDRKDGYSTLAWTTLHLDPLGSQEVPFTALQGLILFGLNMATIIGLAVGCAAARRWRKSRDILVVARFSLKRLFASTAWIAVGCWALANFARMGPTVQNESELADLAALFLPMIAIVAFGLGFGILFGRPRMGLFALLGVVSFAGIVGAVRLAVVLFG